jgi:hypothetical protein
MRGNPPKTTKEQREHILRVFKAKGPGACTELCLKMGLSARYYSKLASERGISGRKSKPLTPAQKQKMLATVRRDDSYDYRWKWAIERGPVVAP